MGQRIETHFQFDEQLMLQILGDNNFPDIYSPFIELIKNAYDACVEREIENKICSVNIDLQTQTITISDNGCGMNESDLFEKWLVVGRSSKKKGKYSLFYQGDKGIGRIAINKIANNVKMFSQKDNENNSLYWESNWETSSYEVREKLDDVGTSFVLSDLRKKWQDKDIEKLKSILSILIYYIKDFTLYLNGDVIENSLPQEIVDGEYDYLVDFSYNSKEKKVYYHLFENEFDSSALSIMLPSIYNQQRELREEKDINDVFKEFNRQNKLLDNIEYEDGGDCGTFSGTIVFRRGKTNAFQMERFHYLEKDDLKCDNAILIYRDNFIVRPFGIGGKNDFFDLSGRVRRSPATQTKEDGRWRARLNNITGFVSISKENNPHLVDQSNRNGLEENKCLDCFRIVVDSALDFLERERQQLMIAIDKKNEREKNKNKERSFFAVVDRLVGRSKGKASIKVSTADIGVIEHNRTVQEENEINVNYDMKRMIYYTTQGLLTLSKYHEIKNECDFIETFEEESIDSMKNVGCFELLQEKYKGKQLTDNLFLLIDKMQSINNINASYSRKIIQEEKKSNFDENITIANILKTINIVKDRWIEKENSLTINVKNDIDEKNDYTVYLSKSDVLSILDNLILNSVQANTNSIADLIITIVIFIEQDSLVIDYSDNGVGLAKEFKKAPYKIFEYGTKGKEGGHGIGMWIVKKAIDMAKGNAEIIDAKKGFCISISLPAINNEDEQ